MARKTKTIELTMDDGAKMPVTVYEVRPLDLWNDFEEIQKGNPEQTQAGESTETQSGESEEAKKRSFHEYEKLLTRCCSLTKTDLAELFPSDLELVFQAWKSVNRSFLSPWPTIKSLIDRLGLAEWLAQVIEESGIKENMKNILVNNWQGLFADLSNEATPEPGNTDGSSLN